MKRLRDLIIDQEDWLIDRILYYAKAHDFTQFTSTLRKAWRASVCGLSAPILEALETFETLPDIRAKNDFSRNTVASFGIEQARQHRARGITLGLFLGLMKYYRQTYVDLILLQSYAKEDEHRYLEYINRFFDYVELGFCTEWSSENEDTALQDMQIKNRLLTNEKNKYLTIFESLHDPVFLLNDDGQIQNMNHAANTLFLGETDPGNSYYATEKKRPLIKQISYLLNKEELIFEAILQTLHGLRHFEVNIQPMLDISEKYQETIVILNDVSEYKAAKEESELANKAKAAFLATMSHEIRTPINGVLGMVDLLSDTNLSATQTKYVNSISQCGTLLLNVLNDTLDYSKFEAGALELEIIDFDINQIIQNIQDIVRPKLEKQNTVFAYETIGAINQFYFGDPAKLQQILLNLIDNAVKFSAKGHVRLNITLLDDSADNLHLLQFDVIDSGIGIDDSKIDLLFMPYMQQDSSTSRLYGGTGLGLAICKKLVQAMNGHIWCENNTDGGAAFSFSIPLFKASQATQTITETVSEPLTGLNILLVEDNHVNQEVAIGFLNRSHHAVWPVETGEDALAILKERPFDLILMDVRMPGMGGIEAVEKIRELEKGTDHRTPVIFLSALADRLALENYFAAGADGFLSKPFKATELNQVISECLSEEKYVESFKPQNTESGFDKILDKTVMQQHLDILGQKRVQRILNAFRTEAPQYFQSLQDAFQKSDFQRLENNAHSLKSASRNVGLMRLNQVMADLEQAAASKDIKTLREISRSAKQIFEESMHALDLLWNSIQLTDVD